MKKRRISAERLENRQMLSANRDIINVSSFAPLETFELPPTTALTTADINQDGIEDLVVSEQALSVLLGDGNGGFQQSESQPLNFGPSPPSEYELLRRPDSIALAVGDMNNDGLPDVVVGGYEKMAVVLSESDTNENWTGFQPPTPLSGSARKLELADFNSDGFLDIASLTGDHVFHADWPTYPGGNLVEFEPRAEIRFGDGEGNFELVDELTAVELYAKELTGDNVADLLIREPDTLQAYTFDGAEFVASETFEIPTFDGVDHYWPGEKDTSPTATEFYFDVGPRYFVNDDPYPDVFISDSYYDFGIGDVSTGTYVAFGTANGDFETPLRISRGAFTDQWERYYPDLLPPPFVIDIDSNGLQDIFIVSDFGNGIAVVRQINSNAYARDAFQYRFPDIPINQSAFADLNQDGLLDAIASASVLANSNGVVGVLFGQPDGGFADATTFEIGHIGELRIFEDATTPFADVSGSHVRSYIRYSHETDTLEVRTIQGPNYYSVYANTNHDNQLDMFSTEWNSDQDSMRLVVYESQSDGSTSIEVIQGSLPSIVNTRHNRAHDVDGDGIEEFLFEYRGPRDRVQVVSRVDGVWQVTNSRQSVSELIGEENVDIQPFRAKGVDGIAVEYSPTDAAVTFVAPFDEPSPNETDLKTVELHFPALHDLSVVSHANTGLRFNHDQARRDVDNDGDLDLIVSHGSGVAVLFAVGEGDFDRSGRPTISDLTLLRTAIGDPSFEDRGRFDLNRDGLLDSADEEAWIADVARTQSGDTDLDGDVDFRDFLTLARNFGAATTNWSDGDFDGNGEVDIADFVALRGNFGFRRD